MKKRMALRVHGVYFVTMRTGRRVRVKIESVSGPMMIVTKRKSRERNRINPRAVDNEIGEG